MRAHRTPRTASSVVVVRGRGLKNGITNWRPLDLLPAAGSGFNGLVLGINNGVAPVFPTPQAGAFNIEVFTNPTVSGLPNPDAGFQSSITDPSGTLDSGFLTGTNLRLGGGDFLAVDSVDAATQRHAKRVEDHAGQRQPDRGRRQVRHAGRRVRRRRRCRSSARCSATRR